MEAPFPGADVEPGNKKVSKTGAISMRYIEQNELKRYLNEILECEAFELHSADAKNGKQNFYIPYMMNDALECYLVLEHATMTGKYQQDWKEPMTVDVAETENGTAAIFHQGTDHVFTIWYERSFCAQNCYRYDQIGHFWVEGEEHWRRLVYIVGTIHDKYSYMGDQVCNEKEKMLMPLMGFAPFRYFSPIHESLDAYYEDTADGITCMKVLAKEAEDFDFLRQLCMYERIPLKKLAVRHLVKAMQNPKRASLYELIFMKIQEASREYPERAYPDELQREIVRERDAVQEILKSHGFSGSYPLFQKDRMQILAMEEHPFTILESEHYGFKIQYMVSEIHADDRALFDGKDKVYRPNAGFFQKKGNRGWIARKLDFLGS